jgi:predicted amidohydrolase
MKLLLIQPQLSFAPGVGNFALIEQLLAPWAGRVDEGDVAVLPEHVVVEASREDYQRHVAALAQNLGCHVIGGSHHEARSGGRVNAGCVSDPRGRIISEYEKLRPYAGERERVHEGAQLGELSIAGRRILVLICADFWFSDVFTRSHVLPDLVLVPAHSVSRKPTPDYSRSLWRHLAIARAYEFGVYVGISDWAYAPHPGALSPSGVGGLADPSTSDPAQFFLPLGTDPVRAYELDFAHLRAFRDDRVARGFFWKPPPRA